MGDQDHAEGIIFGHIGREFSALFGTIATTFQRAPQIAQKPQNLAYFVVRKRPNMLHIGTT